MNNHPARTRQELINNAIPITARARRRHKIFQRHALDLQAIAHQRTINRCIALIIALWLITCITSATYIGIHRATPPTHQRNKQP